MVTLIIFPYCDKIFSKTHLERGEMYSDSQLGSLSSWLVHPIILGLWWTAVGEHRGAKPLSSWSESLKRREKGRKPINSKGLTAMRFSNGPHLLQRLQECHTC